MDDRIFHDHHAHDLGAKRKLFQRSDTACSADFNGSLITLTPTCSITPTELESPTKTLTPVTPVPCANSQFLIEQQNYQFIIQQQKAIQQLATTRQMARGRDEAPKNRQSIDALRVPLSPSIILNDNLNGEELADQAAEQPNKSSRKNSWTNFFRGRSKSTGGTSSGKSPTPSFAIFFSPKQSSNQLNAGQNKQPKRRRMSSIFSFFKRTNKGRASLQDLSRQENDLNKSNLLTATNLDKVTSASSPKVLSDYEAASYQAECTNHEDANCESSYGCIESDSIVLESVETKVIRKSLSSSQSVKEFASQIEIVVKEKDEEFDKKIKEDIWLEAIYLEKEKILDDVLDIERLPKKMNYVSPSQVNEQDKKEVLLKRTLKEADRSDTCDEIRSLPGRLPSFRRKHQHQQTNDSSMNQDTNSESDDQTTTITDQLSTQLSSRTGYYPKKCETANGEIMKNLLEDEDTYNELLYRNELNTSPSRIKLQDKNERLNIKIISIERPRSATPVNFASLETFINSSANKAVGEQDKIKLKLPEDAFSELVNSSGRRLSPRKSSPQIWLEFCERGLQTPKYNTRRNSGTDDPAADKSQASIEEAFTPSIANSSTTETISEYLMNNSPPGDGFEDDFVNACLADLAHVLHDEQARFESDQLKNGGGQLNSQLNNKSLENEQQEIRFEANFSMNDGNEIKQQPAFEQTFDQNNNLVTGGNLIAAVDRHLACENCERCKLNRRLLDEAGETEQLNLLNTSCKCDCHPDNSSFGDFAFSSPKRTFTTNASNLKTHQRRHSISSDISSASSRLISISSTSSSSSGRMSLRGEISTERLDA